MTGDGDYDACRGAADHGERGGVSDDTSNDSDACVGIGMHAAHDMWVSVSRKP